jgi:hypothetical protein
VKVSIIRILTRTSVQGSNVDQFGVVVQLIIVSETLEGWSVNSYYYRRIYRAPIR